MKWIRSQVISSLLFQIVPLPVLAAGASMAPVRQPAAELRTARHVSQVTHQVIEFDGVQGRAIVAGH